MVQLYLPGSPLLNDEAVKPPAYRDMHRELFGDMRATQEENAFKDLGDISQNSQARAWEVIEFLE